MECVTENLTAVNLMKAFAGGSQALNKYEFFAEAAMEEGLHRIARFFQEAADNEKYHAMAEFKAYNKLVHDIELDTTKKNLQCAADGFRNYLHPACRFREEEALVDRAQQLRLSVPEMTVLVGGLRVLGANHGSGDLGRFTDRPGVLGNDFFVHLLDMGIEWIPEGGEGREIFAGRERASGELRYRASRVDLIFGSNSQLRAQAEYYAQEDKAKKFVRDFAGAWEKVMSLDRFDLE